MKLMVLLLIIAFGTARAAIRSGHSSNQMHVDTTLEEELIDDEIIKKCLENGDKEAYNTAKFAGHKLTACGTSLLHTEKLLPEVRAAVLGGGKGIEPIIKKVCRSYETTGKVCLNEYLADLTPCLNESQKEIEELASKIVQKSWDYSCENEGEKARLLFRNPSISCIEMTISDTLQCVSPYLPLFRRYGEPVRAIAKVLSNKECRLFLSASNCIVSELSKCPDTTAAEVVAGSFNETLNISPCKEFADSFEGVVKKTSTMQTLVDAQSLQMVLINRIMELIRAAKSENEREWKTHRRNQEMIHSLIENQSKTLLTLYSLIESTMKRNQEKQNKKH